MRKIAFLEAPICAGSPTDGSQHAYLTLKPIVQEIFGERALFFDHAPSEKKGMPHPEHLRSLEEVMDVSRQIRADVREVLARGDFPITVGGDHSVAMGSIAGAAEQFGAESLSVIYIDGHTDIHTDQTTESGCIHGMPLGQAMGICSDILNIGKEKVHLYGENLFLIGARSIDEGEYPIIRAQGAHLFTAQTVKKRGIEAVMAEVLAEIKTPHVHISFDVDCMDGEVFPATGYRMPNGFGIEEAFGAIRRSFESGRVVSMDLVEYNPLLDGDRSSMEIMRALLALISKALLQ